jgi:hypothetical protein
VNRSANARITAHEMWAATADRTARPEPARQGLEAKLIREAREHLGPDVTEQQVADAAGAGRKAQYARLAAKVVAARRQRKQASGGAPKRTGR